MIDAADLSSGTLSLIRRKQLRIAISLENGFLNLIVFPSDYIMCARTREVVHRNRTAY